MSTGSWDPDADAAAKEVGIDNAIIGRFIAFSADDQLGNLEQLLSPIESQRLAGTMKIDHRVWAVAMQEVSDDDIRHLIRFFAVAENLAGWEAGELSPVIPLARVLRKRGNRLEKEFLLWLREVNDNRFLPYGAL